MEALCEFQAVGVCSTSTNSVTATLKATSVACKYPVRDKHTQFDVLAVVLCVVTGIMVGLRFFEKLRYEKRFRPEDYLVAFYFVSYPSTVFIRT